MILYWQDSSSPHSDSLEKRRYVKQDSDLHGKRSCDHSLEADTSDTATPDILSSGAMTPDPFGLGLNAPTNSSHGALGVVGSLDQELATKLKELTSQVRETQLSSTEDELDMMEYQMGNEEGETKEKVGDDALAIEADSKERSDEIESTNQVRSRKKDVLTSKLRELTSQVSETLLYSTEDELDRCENQTETKGINQSRRTEVLIQHDEKTQTYAEMVEKAEEERSEKRQKDTVVKQSIREQNDTGETQMSEEMCSVSQKQTFNEIHAQNMIVRERTEETKKGEVHTKEKNIQEYTGIFRNMEYKEETEDKQSSKSSEERVQEKDSKSQGDLIENREKQRDSTIEHSAPSGQEEYLSPEEIYNVTNNYSILY